MERKPKVLLIEDNIIDVLPIKTILEEIGCDVIVGFDGRNAVEQIVKNRYDLMVLDWMLPDFNGDQALINAQKIIDDKGGINRKISFVAFSGLSTERLNLPETKNFELVDHWLKPLSLMELTKRVNHYFAINYWAI